MRSDLKLAAKTALQNLYWARRLAPSLLAEPPIAPKSMLFVCKGNICRSPFAALFAAAVARSYHWDLETNSAGLRASPSESPPAEALTAAQPYGVDLSQHVPHPIAPAMLRNAALVLVMEPSQATSLFGEHPEVREKTRLLSAFDIPVSLIDFSVPRYAILDPYGLPHAAFVDCYARIARCIQGLFERIYR